MFDTKKGKNKKPVNDWIINRYEEQHERGSKGFGVVRINPSLTYEVKRACEPAKFLMDIEMKPVQMMIAHHRMPTSTDNYLDQTHPLFVSDKSLKFDYLVIHNGIISNDDELKERHEKMGLNYRTKYSIESTYNPKTIFEKYNDSETLAIELALYLEGNRDKEGKVQGSAAFIALQINKTTQKIHRVYFARNSSPLHMAKSRGFIKLSSEGEGDNIKEKRLYSFEPKGEMKLTNVPLGLLQERQTLATSYFSGNESTSNTLHVWDPVKRTYVTTEKTPIGFQGQGTLIKTEEKDPEKIDIPPEDEPTIDDEFLTKLGELKEEMEGIVDDFFNYLDVYPTDTEDIPAITHQIEELMKKACFFQNEYEYAKEVNEIEKDKKPTENEELDNEFAEKLASSEQDPYQAPYGHPDNHEPYGYGRYGDEW